MICKKELKRYFASPIAYALLISAGMVFALGVMARDPGSLMGPVSVLTGFVPTPELGGFPRAALMIGLTRIVLLYLAPLITMRLFIEERRAGTLALLLTSPIRDRQIVWGKWAAAFVLYLAIVALSVAVFGAIRWPEVAPRILVAAYTALVVQGAGLLAVGEWLSTMTRHETVAAFWTVVVCAIVLRFCRRGLPDLPDMTLCTALLSIGWFLTQRSIKTFRLSTHF